MQEWARSTTSSTSQCVERHELWRRSLGGSIGWLVSAQTPWSNFQDLISWQPACGKKVDREIWWTLGWSASRNAEDGWRWAWWEKFWVLWVGISFGVFPTFTRNDNTWTLWKAPLRVGWGTFQVKRKMKAVISKMVHGAVEKMDFFFKASKFTTRWRQGSGKASWFLSYPSP